MAKKKRSKTSSNPSKKYVSGNTKYYKDSEVAGVTDHVNRKYLDNKNAFEEHSHLNFGNDDLFSRYKALHAQKEQQTGKKARKDATTYAETVLAFSVAQYDRIRGKALEKYLGDEEAADKAVERVFTKCFEEYQAEIKNRFGLEPVGFNMHLDEGHIDESGKLIKNVHGHVGFYNYDFEKGVSPWRHIGKKQLSEMQDIADHCFARLGFERGVSAEQTRKKHLEKDEFVSQKRKAMLEAIEQTKQEFKQKMANRKAKEEADFLELKERNEAEILKEQKELERVKSERSSLIEQYKEEVREPNKLFQRFLHNSFNYVRSLLLGSSSEDKLKSSYEKSKEKVEQVDLTNEQEIIFTDTVEEIRGLENPSTRPKNTKKLKY